MRKWICACCGWIYDEAEGDPERDIAPGTAWQELPPQWCCPACQQGRDQFELVEIVG